MTDYDGVIWTVADPERDPAATEFVPVDTAAARPRRAAARGHDDRRAHRRRSRDLGGNFLPAAGIARRLDCSRRATLDPRLNLGTGTSPCPAASPTG